MAKIVDHGELKQFKRQILHLQAELNQDIQDKINFRIFIKNRQRAAIDKLHHRITIKIFHNQSVLNFFNPGIIVGVRLFI